MTIQTKDRSPPSTYAIARLVDKDPGAMADVAWLTAKRLAFIWPGVFFYSQLFDREMGVAKQLVLSSLVSLSISGGLYIYYKARER